MIPLRNRYDRSRSPQRHDGKQLSEARRLTQRYSRSRSPRRYDRPATSSSRPRSPQTALSASANAVIPRTRDVNNRIVGPPMSQKRRDEVFPAPDQSPVSRLALMCSQTPFLIIWNIPNLFTWDDILLWVQETLPLAWNAWLTKLMRTCEQGLQVFWLVFKTAKEASTFRGIAENRVTDKGHTARCDFVSLSEYSGACGHCRDIWEYGRGHWYSILGAAPFAALQPTYTPKLLAGLLKVKTGPRNKKFRRGTRAGKSLLERLDGMPPQDPADGGAL